MNQEFFEATYPEEVYQLNQRPIIVIHVNWNELTDNERELLSKILAAIKIPIDAVRIITQPLLDLSRLQGNTNRVIYFGSVNDGTAYYQVLATGEITYICAEPLRDLLSNEAARKQLWAALRQAFFA